MEKPKFVTLNTSAFEIQWPELLDESTFEQVICTKQQLEKVLESELLDCVNTYNSICLFFKQEQDWNIKLPVINALICNLEPRVTNPKSEVIRIPLHLESKTALSDLDQISKLTGLCKEEVISTFIKPVYTVGFIGFLPGFPYLLGLPGALHIPRKTKPNQHIPQGAVAIGGKQAGIYSQSSPGGWYVLGFTDFSLFQIRNDRPVCLKSGDRVLFTVENNT